MYELETLITNNKELLVILSLWELVWKGLALWRAARNNQRYWYFAILVLNTLGILPIAYLVYSKTKVKKSN